ncbi:MAG: hypothetical protein H6739_37610 [Alphaproteobacteria bacterium]|nr:hypothetical protein [Alphaproteobacteria bacterium]
MRSLLALTLLFAAGCDRVFVPPDDPPHDDFEEGYGHARGKELPFLCRDPETGGRVTCPDTGRPEPAFLSCDAAGCHGSMTYSGEWPEERHLHGGDGPSCYTCHNREWSERMEVTP